MERGDVGRRAGRVAVATALSLALLATPALPRSCSRDSDCREGERCAQTGSSVVEECFLFIFCDRYTVYQLECREAQGTNNQGGANDDDNQQLAIVCINDQFYMQGLCRFAVHAIQWLIDTYR